MGSVTSPAHRPTGCPDRHKVETPCIPTSIVESQAIAVAAQVIASFSSDVGK